MDATLLHGPCDRVLRDRCHGNPIWFWPALFGVAVFGVLVRVVFSLSNWSRGLTADAHFFHVSAAFIANGQGYETLAGDPTANHPPVFSLILALFDLLGLHTVGEQRIAVSIVTGAAVLLLGLVGREAAGPTVGLVAASIAAANPNWFQSSGILMSESVYLIVIPGILLVALGCINRPVVWRFGILGLLIAIATLIRSEAIDFALLLGIPVVLIATEGWRRRLQAGIAIVVGILLVLTPWLVRDEIQLGGASLSTNGGVTLAGSYCPASLDPNNSSYGSFNTPCAVSEYIYLIKHTRPPGGAKAYTELSLNQAATSGAETFALGHLNDMPGLVVARELSVWGFGNRDFQLSLATAEGRIPSYEQAGEIVYWVLLPFVLLGIVVLVRRSWKRFVVVAVPLVVVALNSAIFYGSTRMRTAAEPSLAVLAAVGLVAALSFVIELRHQPSPG